MRGQGDLLTSRIKVVDLGRAQSSPLIVLLVSSWSFNPQGMNLQSLYHGEQGTHLLSASQLVGGLPLGLLTLYISIIKHLVGNLTQVRGVSNAEGTVGLLTDFFTAAQVTFRSDLSNSTANIFNSALVSFWETKANKQNPKKQKCFYLLRSISLSHP